MSSRADRRSEHDPHQVLKDDEGLGTLLLDGSTSERAMRLLVDELRNGDTRRVEQWLGRSATTAEWLAGCEGIIRAIGLVLTIPNSNVPPALEAATPGSPEFLASFRLGGMLLDHAPGLRVTSLLAVQAPDLMALHGAEARDERDRVLIIAAAIFMDRLFQSDDDD